ncbi:MAG: thiamine phosphate synthase, partial [Hungatella sp.]
VSGQTLKDICAAVHIPVVAIGGITAENMKHVAGSGICGVAVVSAIFAEDNIEEAARRLKCVAAAVTEKG